VEISADGDREEEDNSLNIWQLRIIFVPLPSSNRVDNLSLLRAPTTDMRDFIMLNYVYFLASHCFGVWERIRDAPPPPPAFPL
jgi:hypothetical protein